MPGGDRTGSRGFGPMTGRTAGFCTGFGIPGYANYTRGRGSRIWGRGRGGGGRGYRHWFYETGLTGWQRAAGYTPEWGNPFAYGGPYNVPLVPVVNRRQEVDSLKARAEYLEEALERIRIEVKNLEAKQAGTASG